MAGKPFDSWLKRQSVETRSPTRLLLASASPRRREILESLGVEFDVVVPRVEELTEGDPDEVVLENARRKATAGFANAPQGAVALGVDTEVVLDGRAFGKPRDAQEAETFLRRLSGRTHEVISGVALCLPHGEERTYVAFTRVRFRMLEQRDIDWYLASGEWRDRAGGYAIQGRGAALVMGIEGDYWNVVGLPVSALVGLAPELFESPTRSR
jgi:septum formation protein